MFVKGKSGNPMGRKKLPPFDAQIALTELAPDAVRALKRVVKSKTAGHAQVRAAEIILDRLYGKPSQELKHTGADGGTLRIEVVYVSKVNGHE